MNKAQLADVSPLNTIARAKSEINKNLIAYFFFHFTDNNEAFQDNTNQRKRNSHLFYLHG